MIKKLLRQPFRRYLRNITIQTLNKHEPSVIAVMGNGQTAYAREAIYYALNPFAPVRRNVESPEAEFSVPLTIIGYPSYPANIMEWIKFVLYVSIAAKKIKPYKHILILELNSQKQEILEFWLEAIKPEVGVIVGSTPVDYSTLGLLKLVKITDTNNENNFGGAKMAALQIAKFFRFDQSITEEALEKMEPPVAKVNMLPGKNESWILDTTYNYLPIKIEAVFELVDPQASRVVLISSNKSDIKKFKRNASFKNIIINPKNFSPQKNDYIIVRGRKQDTFSIIETLTT